MHIQAVRQISEPTVDFRHSSTQTFSHFVPQHEQPVQRIFSWIALVLGPKYAFDFLKSGLIHFVDVIALQLYFS